MHPGALHYLVLVTLAFCSLGDTSTYTHAFRSTKYTTSSLFLHRSAGTSCTTPLKVTAFTTKYNHQANRTKKYIINRNIQDKSTSTVYEKAEQRSSHVYGKLDAVYPTPPFLSEAAKPPLCTKKNNPPHKKSRRSFLKNTGHAGALIITSFLSWFPKKGASLAVAAPYDETSMKSNMNNNVDDPFTSFGESLNQMDFGTISTGSSSNNSFDENSRSLENRQLEKNRANNNVVDSNEKSLTDVIQEKKKQRVVDPRTHG